MSRPNLLFIQTDQQKARSLDLYSDVNAIDTANIRRIADEGVVFDNGYCPLPLCVPSRISMLTGLYPSASGYVGNKPYPMGDRYPTLFSAARRDGYRTMLVGKDHAIGLPGHAKWEPTGAIAQTFDRIYSAWHGGKMNPEINRDLPHIEPFLQGTPELQTLWGSAVAPWSSDTSISARLSDVAVEYLSDWRRDDKPSGTPFAMWLSYPDPHEFYQAPRDVVDMIDPSSIELPPNWECDMSDRAEFIQYFHWYFNAGGVPEDVARKLIRIYLAMCKNVDMVVGRVLDYLQDNGEWQNTIIVYTSDHGDFNGEMQLLQKFNAGYDGCCRVPLIVAYPGHSRRGARCDDPVNLVDIPSTLMPWMELEPLPGDQGRPFADALTSDAFDPRTYTVVESGVPGESLTRRDIANFPDHRWNVTPEGRWCYDPPHRFGGKMYAVRTRDFKLIVRQDQRHEFYDYRVDPWETRNRVDDASLQGDVLRHYQYLAQHVARIAPNPPGTEIAPQDAFYRAGGDATWAASLAASRSSSR